MKKNVVGFLFDVHGHVLLQLQAPTKKYTGGKLNGIGGKVEIGETPNGAMRREAFEEANITLPGDMRWQQFHYERHQSGNELYFYTAQLEVQFYASGMFENLSPAQIEQTKREPLYVFNPSEARSFGYVPNLSYLLPMAQHWLAYPSEHYLEG